MKKIGLNEKYDNGHHKITTHSFRAYFITKISRQDPNFAKKLAGQKGYLLQYDRMTDEEKLQKYLEIENELLIFDESKKNAEMEKLKKENSSLTQIYEDEIKRTLQTVDYLVEEIEKLKKHRVG
jgi:spore coat polysaccharide biosynthesis predicted glycosyltransferase SpsG